MGEKVPTASFPLPSLLRLEFQKLGLPRSVGELLPLSPFPVIFANENSWGPPPPPLFRATNLLSHHLKKLLLPRLPPSSHEKTE